MLTGPSSGSDVPGYELTLFVSGASALSARAIANATQMCDLHLGNGYRLSVIDIHGDPASASSGVLAAPTLVKNRPLPERRVVGDLSDTRRVLAALELPRRD